MIGFLRGKAIILENDYAVIDTNGVGYQVFISSATRGHIRLNEEISLFIHTSVREDAITLYGFFSQSEHEAFTHLITVTGIGPKGALLSLSSITPERLYKAIQNKETGILTKLPGIGKKTAERMILELKDKVAYIGEAEEESEVITDSDTVLGESKEALMALGISAGEAAVVLKKIKSKDSVESVIKEALKMLNKF